MKKQQSQNGTQPVTLNQLKQVLRQSFTDFEKKINKKFEQIDKRFEQIDKRFEQVDKEFEQIYRRFEQIDERFKQVDTRFKEMGGWFQAAQSIHALYTDRAIQGLEERLSKKHDNMMSLLDKFLKRVEGNEREIIFFGNQHDDLAKYCHEKIAYPEYGRKL